jgi:hypothetical protein
MLQQNTAHKATQTIENTLHSMHTTHESKAIPVSKAIQG